MGQKKRSIRIFFTKSCIFAHLCSYFQTMLVNICRKSCANFRKIAYFLRKPEILEGGSVKNAVNSWGINMMIQLLRALRREEGSKLYLAIYFFFQCMLLYSVRSSQRFLHNLKSFLRCRVASGQSFRNIGDFIQSRFSNAICEDTFFS